MSLPKVLLCLVPLAAASCGGTSLRPVVSVEPTVAEAIWTRDEIVERPAKAVDAADLARRLRSIESWILSDRVEHRTEAPVPGTGPPPAGTLGPLMGRGPAQLDPGLGPVDLGYPILIDLGAGDAPYDDGVRTIHAEEPKRGGFSDTIIQMLWRQTVSPMTSVHTGAALQRFQDLGILDGLSDAEFAWAIVGLQLRF